MRHLTVTTRKPILSTLLLITFLTLCSFYQPAFADKTQTARASSDFDFLPQHDPTTTSPAETNTLSIGISEDKTQAFIQGRITDDFHKIIEALPKTVKTIRIESGGGSVNAAIRASEIIRDRKITTVTLLDCFSACTLIFQAGVERKAGTQTAFMYHKPKNKVSYRFLSDGAKKDFQEAVFAFQQKYKEYGLDSKFVDKIMVCKKEIQKRKDPRTNEIKEVEVCISDYHYYAQELKDKNIITEYYGPEIQELTLSYQQLAKKCEIQKQGSFCKSFENFNQYLDNMATQNKTNWNSSSWDWNWHDNPKVTNAVAQ